ncbi:cache domain-containing sensor histidine kinase [Paenibacillus oceani]|uniref:Sensor histidine kinase n=1 Tax=Paenibacillus oceani TaxID=2772510 RepID=A0A927CHH3_9BACL|nr:sensor histidine kinase [Paenibacillus oceani]MBD2865840.1 sensor histidine kinase [Paenibacillus oceani]
MNRSKLAFSRKRTIKSTLLMFAVGSLAVFAVVTFLLILWFQNVLEQKIRTSAEQALGTAISGIEMYMENTVKLSESIAASDNLLKQLGRYPDFRSPDAVWPLLEVMGDLKSFSVVNQYIDSVGIYNETSNKMLTTKDGIYSASSASDPGAKPDWLQGVKDYKGTPLIGADLIASAPSYAESHSGLVSVARLLRASDGGGANVLLVNTEKSIFEMLVGDSPLWKGTGILIYDGGGNVIWSKGDPDFQHAAAGRIVPEQPQDGHGGEAWRFPASEYAPVALGDREYRFVQKQSELTGWKVAMCIPEEEIMGEIRRMKLLLYAVLAVLVLLSFALFTLLYMQISTPIRQLMAGIRRVESGAPFVPVPISRMDEFGYLQKRFNDMVVNEQQMRQAMFEQELRGKDVELKLLQSQMNPHFLYNTLDSIYWAAERSDNNEISDMVLDLSRFFRLSLSRGKEFVTVRETIDHLKTYIRIQQFRHKGKFEVEWDIDGTLHEVKIIKLMLQPVVENAIVHGLEALADACRLRVRTVRDGPWILFEVTDSGIGIPAPRLKELLEAVRDERPEGGKTYGLRNLYQRLRLIYGEEDMRFEMTSEPFGGTTVAIRIAESRLEGGRHEDEGDDRRG